jgi:hypothetical protein
MSAHELDDGAIWTWWCRQSAEQGLDPEIDPTKIRRVAELALAGYNGGPGSSPGRRSTTPPPRAKGRGDGTP